MKETTIILFACVFYISATCGCVSVPNYKTNGTGGSSTVDASQFKYGKYCGAGHPTFDSEPGTQQRTMDLMSLWPPIDDIDLMCYAHDLCYQLTGSQNLICDQALSATAVSNTEAFSKKSGCNNLAKLIGAGLGAKVSGSEKNKSAALGITVANAVWTLPISAMYYALNIGSIEKYGFPTSEGTCFKNDVIALHTFQMISDFEAEYREYAEGFEFFTRASAGFKNVSIPIPINNWSQVFPIFETQKYLNYFGYNAGPADGKMGANTREAIRRFKTRNNLVVEGILPVLEELKKGYLKEPVTKRDTLPPDEKRRLYGYLE